MIKAIVVDDEVRVRKVICTLLSDLCKDVHVMGQAGDVESAVELIEKTNPDLVFLDVEMPGGSGFDVLDKTGQMRFRVIFITAYAQHAIHAIKMAALDYVMKPVDSDELVKAVDRYRRIQATEGDVRSILDALHKAGNLNRIGIASVGKVDYIDINDIVRFESEGSYTTIFTANGNKLVSTKPIREYEDMLIHKDFFRVHRSHLINMGMVRSFNRSQSEFVLMTDGSEVEISRFKRREFLNAMEGR